MEPAGASNSDALHSTGRAEPTFFSRVMLRVGLAKPLSEASTGEAPPTPPPRLPGRQLKLFPFLGCDFLLCRCWHHTSQAWWRMSLLDRTFFSIIVTLCLRVAPSMISCFGSQWINCNFTSSEFSFGLLELDLDLPIFGASTTSYHELANKDIEGTGALMILSYSILAILILGLGLGTGGALLACKGFRADESEKLVLLKSAASLLIFDAALQANCVLIYGIIVAQVLQTITMKDVVIRVGDLNDVDPNVVERAAFALLQRYKVCSADIQTWRAGAVLETISAFVSVAISIAAVSVCRIIRKRVSAGDEVYNTYYEHRSTETSLQPIPGQASDREYRGPKAKRISG
jgi:hypothetical protein